MPPTTVSTSVRTVSSSPSSAVAGLAVEGDGHRRHAARVGDDVGAGAAGQRVVAVAAVERVVAGLAVDRVVAGAARQHVGEGAAEHRVVARAADRVLDVGLDEVGLARHAVVGDGVDPHRDGRRAGRVVGHVGAGAAVEDVGQRAADQRVVAPVAVQRVRSAGAVEAVRVGAAVERVGPVAAGDHVVAGAAGQRGGHGAGAEGDRVIAVAGVEVERRDPGRRAGHLRRRRGGEAAGADADRVSREVRDRVVAAADRHRELVRIALGGDVRQRAARHRGGGGVRGGGGDGQQDRGQECGSTQRHVAR